MTRPGCTASGALVDWRIVFQYEGKAIGIIARDALVIRPDTIDAIPRTEVPHSGLVEAVFLVCRKILKTPDAPQREASNLIVAADPHEAAQAVLKRLQD